MANPTTDELIELCERALHGALTFEELELAWPSEPDDPELATIREDLFSGVEHTPGYWDKPGVDPQKWRQMPVYADIRRHLDRLRSKQEPSAAQSRYLEFERALEELIRSEAADVIATGRASLDVRDERDAGGPSRVLALKPTRTTACPVTVLAQSDREVSFFVSPPERPDALTVDSWARDRDELFEDVREYLRAVLAGRVEAETRAASSGGCAVFILADGERVEHYYNAIRRPRLRKWTVHTFEPYELSTERSKCR